MFSVDLFSLKKCFGVLRDNYQTNSSVKLGTIHLGQRLAPLPLVHRSPGVKPALGTLSRVQGNSPLTKRKWDPP